MTDPIAIAREVLKVEMEGIAALSEGLDERFAAAVDMLAGVPGRIIVTGMGKSGHVGRKIAATFASTGRPALFVHPGEASHGDLGMVLQGDLILALSKSGETAELSDLLAYAGRFDIPVVAITGGGGSTLAGVSECVLLLPPVAEACGETRAPTTSTTMMLALGDALAIALLRRAGFSASDFKDFHPGGNLGAALRRVRDLMHKDALPLCGLETALKDAAALIGTGGLGCVGVTAGGRLEGILTDGDVRRLVSRGETGGETPIGAVMTRDPVTVTPETLAGEALALMSGDKITALFVIDGQGRPVGLLHVHDCLSSGVL